MNSHEIDYRIFGDDMQCVEIELDPNETVIAEAGGMMMMEDHIEMNDNFYLMPNGIGFYYNPYEVAAYAVGTTDLFIPFSEIQAFLQPEYRR